MDSTATPCAPFDRVGRYGCSPAAVCDQIRQWHDFAQVVFYEHGNPTSSVPTSQWTHIRGSHDSVAVRFQQFACRQLLFIFDNNWSELKSLSESMLHRKHRKYRLWMCILCQCLPSPLPFSPLAHTPARYCSRPCWPGNYHLPNLCNREMWKSP